MVVFSILHIIYFAILTILAATGFGVATSASVVAANNDQEEDAVVTAYVAGATGLLAIGFALGICFGVFQLMGALKYNVCMLSTCLVFQLFVLAYNLYYYWVNQTSVGQYIGTLIATVIVFGAMWIYPLVGLIKEIKAGTMSEETYPREAYSCCCEPKV